MHGFPPPALDELSELVRRFGRAAEYRQDPTGLHAARVGRYAEAIAAAAGMKPAEARTLGQAAARHDAGMVAVPDRVLYESDRLDAADRAVVKNHTSAGARMLAGHDSPVMRRGSIVSLTHHERWNGSGYPRALAGEAIGLDSGRRFEPRQADAVAAIRSEIERILESMPSSDPE